MKYLCVTSSLLLTLVWATAQGLSMGESSRSWSNEARQSISGIETVKRRTDSGIWIHRPQRTIGSTAREGASVDRGPIGGSNVDDGRGWETIFFDDMEGDFPGNNWGIYHSGTNAYWDDWDCWYGNSPSQSAGCADGGAAGIGCGDDYPNDMNSWMVYGPFSLADGDITDAEVNFEFKLESELGCDYFGVYVSVNEYNYYGVHWSGNIERSYSFDLTDVYTLGNLIGQSQIWIAFVFDSDASGTAPEGAQVDDVLIQKYVENLYPDIDVSMEPDPMDFNLDSGQQTTGTITITNTGTANLDVTAIYDNQNNPDWLREDQGSIYGIGPGEHRDVTVTIDASGLNGGSYDGTITIESNAGDRIVDVHLDVAGYPDIRTDPTSEQGFEFDLLAGDSVRTRLVIWNDGTANLSVNRISDSATWLETDPGGIGLDIEISPQENTLVVVMVNADTLVAGAYSDTIVIGSNDHDESPLGIPVSLIVSGEPEIEVEPPDMLELNVLAGAEGERAFTIRNIGTTALEVTSITAEAGTLDWLSVEGGWENEIPPGDSTQVTVKADATELLDGEYAGSITIESDAVNDSLYELAIVLQVRGSPEIWTDPDSTEGFDIAVEAGGTRKDTLVIGNSGTADLVVGSIVPESEGDWLIVDPTSISSIAPGASTFVEVKVDADTLVAGGYVGRLKVSSNDTLHSLVMIPVHMDVGGYPEIVVSPDSIAFIDIAADDSSSTILLIENRGTANLQLYTISVEMDTLNWLIADPLSDFDPIEPEGQIEVTVTARTVGLIEDAYAGRLVIFHEEAPGTSTAIPVHLEVGGEPRIDIPDTLFMEAELGQSADTVLPIVSVGTTVLRVTGIEDDAEWLEVDPGGIGRSIDPGDTLYLAVYAEAMTDTGYYETDLRIYSNDNTNSPAKTLVHLEVVVPSGPRIVVSPEHLFFKVEPDSSNTQTLLVENRGTAVLEVERITRTENWLAMDTTGFTIPPEGSQDIAVEISAAGFVVGDRHAGTLTIVSNDPVKPEVDVQVFVLTGGRVNTLAASDTLSSVSYRMISIPGAKEGWDRGVDEILGVSTGLGDYDNTRWRLWRAVEQAGSAKYEEYYPVNGVFDNLSAGEGYWLIVCDGGKTLTAKHVDLCADSVFSIPLTGTWQMIGNPYTFGIPLESVSSTYDISPLWYYTGTGANSGYDSVEVDSVLSLWEGYFVKGVAGDTLILHAHGELGGGLLSPSLPEYGEEWVLCFNVRSEAGADGGAEIGVVEGADCRVVEKPPPTPSGVDVWVRGEAGERLFQWLEIDDADTDGWSWEIGVRIPSSKGELSWEGAWGVPEDLEVMLMEERDEEGSGRVIDMRAVDSVSLSGSAGAYIYRVLIGTEEYIKGCIDSSIGFPRELVLLEPVPNPSKGEVLLRFCLAEGGQAHLSLYDLSGREVGVVKRDGDGAGWHEIEWPGGVLPSGVYVWRLEQGGEFRTVRQVIIK